MPMLGMMSPYSNPLSSPFKRDSSPLIPETFCFQDQWAFWRDHRDAANPHKGNIKRFAIVNTIDDLYQTWINLDPSSLAEGTVIRCFRNGVRPHFSLPAGANEGTSVLFGGKWCFTMSGANRECTWMNLLVATMGAIEFGDAHNAVVGVVLTASSAGDQVEVWLHDCSLGNRPQVADKICSSVQVSTSSLTFVTHVKAALDAREAAAAKAAKVAAKSTPPPEVGGKPTGNVWEKRKQAADAQETEAITAQNDGKLKELLALAKKLDSQSSQLIRRKRRQATIIAGNPTYRTLLLREQTTTKSSSWADEDPEDAEHEHHVADIEKMIASIDTTPTTKEQAQTLNLQLSGHLGRCEQQLERVMAESRSLLFYIQLVEIQQAEESARPELAKDEQSKFDATLASFNKKIKISSPVTAHVKKPKKGGALGSPATPQSPSIPAGATPPNAPLSPPDAPVTPSGLSRRQKKDAKRNMLGNSSMTSEPGMGDSVLSGIQALPAASSKVETTPLSDAALPTPPTVALSEPVAAADAPAPAPGGKKSKKAAKRAAAAAAGAPPDSPAATPLPPAAPAPAPAKKSQDPPASKDAGKDASKDASKDAPASKKAEKETPSGKKADKEAPAGKKPDAKKSDKDTSAGKKSEKPVAPRDTPPVRAATPTTQNPLRTPEDLNIEERSTATMSAAQSDAGSEAPGGGTKKQAQAAPQRKAAGKSGPPSPGKKTPSPRDSDLRPKGGKGGKGRQPEAGLLNNNAVVITASAIIAVSLCSFAIYAAFYL